MENQSMISLRYNALLSTIAFALCCWAAPVDAAINAGDRVNVHVYNHPELSTVATVDSHGIIQLPVIGSIRVQGLESNDAARAIRRRIEAYVPYPAVDVQDMSELQSIFVSGGPGGVLPYTPNETLSSALAEIAKITQFSDTAQTPPNAQLDRFDHSRIDLKRVAIYRNGQPVGTYNMIALREIGNPGPVLYPSDTIAFSDKPIRVQVNGAVNTPGPAYLWPDEALSDAIAQAGGPSPAAASGHIELMHADRATEIIAMGDPLFNRPATAGDVVTIPTAPRVTVAGFVNHSGVVTLQNDFTLLSALASAGGYDKFADLRKVQLVHQGTKSEYNIVALVHGNLTQNPVLHDGDTVFVPEGHKTDWSQVFGGLGAVGALSGFGLLLTSHH
jgi:protein involved in polysaccharide export with SLBB domain